ncbi:ferredoxin [Umezawaea tangerina]|uniref:Ferredoxin n=1 Tax=Umezawaea tangerina TaxID=84725 RepID=A0A2T0T011_9PSEU|nr:ferredoxin [Umezawaea tangerina]PRY39002.1 ferredoxin [Umezawaea tangerina]
MNIEVDQGKCVGSGQCVLAADDVFDQRDDGLVDLLNASPPPERLTDVRHAAAVCPSAAIAVSE